MTMDTPGIYWGLLESATMVKARTGTMQMVITFEITHIENDEFDKIDPFKRKIWLSCHDNSMAYTTDKLREMGFNGDFERPDFGDSAKHEGMKLTCVEHTYKGQTSPRWDLARKDFAASNAPSERELKTLNAKYAAQQP